MALSVLQSMYHGTVSATLCGTQSPLETNMNHIHPTADDDKLLAQLIGHRISKSRMDAGYSYSNKAAEVLGLTRALYSCYERGQRLDVVARWINLMDKVIAPEFNVSAAYLMGLIDDQISTREFETRLQIGKQILSRAGGSARNVLLGETFAHPISSDMGPHKKGDILFFERSEGMPSDGGLFAIDAGGGKTLIRWITPLTSGKWKITDGHQSEELTDEQVAALNISGTYRCKITDL